MCIPQSQKPARTGFFLGLETIFVANESTSRSVFLSFLTLTREVRRRSDPNVWSRFFCAGRCGDSSAALRKLPCTAALAVSKRRAGSVTGIQLDSGPERRQEDSPGTSKNVSQPGIEPGSQELASCAITTRPPQPDTTGPRHRAFDVFQFSCYRFMPGNQWAPLLASERAREI